MLATTGDLPEGHEWAFEFKWDGIRALVDVSQEHGVRVTSRTGRDITVAFPELAELAEQVPDAMLDGELVGFDTEGKISFGKIIERMHATDPAQIARLTRSHPIAYLIFDLMRFDQADTRTLSYTDRRALLEELDLVGGAWQTPGNHSDGAVTMAVALENELEGVVAKRRTATYQSRRSHDWVKVKPEFRLEVVVGGWRRQVREVGSILVGEPTADDRLRFRGRVAAGISAGVEAELLRLLRPLETNVAPFDSGVTVEDARGTTWVRPELVVEVDYGSITPDGRLRFSRLRRVRIDRAVTDVRR